MPAKECPMCGETMRVRESNVTDRVPGTPECDYFEEVEAMDN